MDLQKAKAALADCRRNLQLRAAVREAGERVRAATKPVGVWEVLRDAAPACGAAAVALTLGRLAGRRGSGPWERGFEELDGDCLRARTGLIAERPCDDHVDLAWIDGRDTVDRDTEIAIELLCEHLSVALDRIKQRAAEGPIGQVGTRR